MTVAQDDFVIPPGHTIFESLLNIFNNDFDSGGALSQLSFLYSPQNSQNVSDVSL